MTKDYARIEYGKFTLTESDLKKHPMDQFDGWWQDAVAANVQLVDAAYLATVDKNNYPDGRIVLLKMFDQHGLVFYTNYESKKAQQLAAHPQACLVMFWTLLERQIRIKGRIEKTSREQSEEYFASRPRGAQISAWASPQSMVLKDRHKLQSLYQLAKEHFKDKTVPCPPHWGGYRLIPNYFEFWQGQANRLHDRFCYELIDGNWQICRLAP